MRWKKHQTKNIIYKKSSNSEIIDCFCQDTLAKNDVSNFWDFWKYLTTYLFKTGDLFKTGELEQLFFGNEDEDDFSIVFVFFVTKHASTAMIYKVLMNFVFISIRSISYTEDRNKFWQTFFLSKVTEYKVTNTWFLLLRIVFRITNW